MLGYHLAFWIAAGLVVAAIVVALTVLQPTPQAADTSEPGPQLAGADPAMSEAHAHIARKDENKRSADEQDHVEGRRRHRLRARTIPRSAWNGGKSARARNDVPGRLHRGPRRCDGLGVRVCGAERSRRRGHQDDRRHAGGRRSYDVGKRDAGKESGAPYGGAWTGPVFVLTP